jgi:hypothetical protein
MSWELLKSQCPLAQHATSQDLKTIARIAVAASLAVSISMVRSQAAAAHHLLYVASPGIRNYVDHGGVGILVFDITPDTGLSAAFLDGACKKEKPENVKGIVAADSVYRS